MFKVKYETSKKFQGYGSCSQAKILPLEALQGEAVANNVPYFNREVPLGLLPCVTLL
jgi:hypothetical protein